ncbi:POP1_domain-containing protein [Hexamita inflata]|uniref:POP1 domain-containing protein n=1 Tax=Hexamita inflata TaxID=28002 RepID=A0AA86UAN3_9EUKA|nr:POP1 domain-containing protein [Hexamita inflata]
MQQQIKLVEQIQQLLPQLMQLQSTRRKFVRAHQILPRHRRRRQMSYNFHRLPQSVRARALRETNSKDLIFAQNAPTKSRKARRAHSQNDAHRFLAKRMHISRLRLERLFPLENGCYKICLKNHQKLLRYSQRTVYSVVDRSESAYSVLKMSKNEQFKPGFQFIDQIPVEICGDIILCYSWNVDKLREKLKCNIDSHKNFLVLGNIKEFCKTAQLEHTVQKCPDYEFFSRKKLIQTGMAKRDLNNYLHSDIVNYLDEAMVAKLHRMYVSAMRKEKTPVLDNNLVLKQENAAEMNENSIVIHQISERAASVYIPQNKLKHFYKIIGTVLGTKEKRYSCYQHRIIDFVESLQIEEIEDEIQPPAKQMHVVKKEILASKEFKKYLMTNVKLSDVKFAKEEKVVVEKKVINPHEFVKQKFTNGTGLFCCKDGKKIGLSPKGEIDVNAIVL